MMDGINDRNIPVIYGTALISNAVRKQPIITKLKFHTVKSKITKIDFSKKENYKFTISPRQKLNFSHAPVCKN